MGTISILFNVSIVYDYLTFRTLSLSGNNDDGPGIFATIFVLIWVGSFVVTLNA